MSMDELANVRGRGWEDIDVSATPSSLSTQTNSILIFPIALSENLIGRSGGYFYRRDRSSEQKAFHGINAA